MFVSTSGVRCIPRPVVTGHVSCVCDWSTDANGLDFGDWSWICNVAQNEISSCCDTSNVYQVYQVYQYFHAGIQS